MRTQVLFLFGVAAAIVGCTAFNSKSAFMDNGLAKASFDMHCEKEKLEVTELAPGSMGVRGCGRQSRYEHVPGSTTTWVLNSDAK